jgi:hypothetical protein
MAQVPWPLNTSATRPRRAGSWIARLSRPWVTTDTTLRVRRAGTGSGVAWWRGGRRAGRGGYDALVVEAALLPRLRPQRARWTCSASPHDAKHARHAICSISTWLAPAQVFTVTELAGPSAPRLRAAGIKVYEHNVPVHHAGLLKASAPWFAPSA